MVFARAVLRARISDMATDNSIFGLRFGSNPELNPTRAELRIFLDVTRKTGTGEPHRNDLARYDVLVENLLAFEHRPQPDVAMDIREKVFFSILRNSRFVNPALELAVEQYKYHLHSLNMLDLRKPAAFIKVAETEIGRIPPKKKSAAEAAKVERLRGMVDERKQTLAALNKKRTALVEELTRIVRYVRNNLVRIERLCEASIVILAELQISAKEEQLWVDDIKEKVKEQLRDSLHQSQLSRQDLDAARKDIAALSQETTSLLRQDLFAMGRLYEAILGHAREAARLIDGLLAEANKGGKRALEDEQAFFTKIETALVSLVSDYQFDLTMPEQGGDTRYGRVLRETRRDMLQHVVTVLEEERRNRRDRRSGEERRRYRLPRPSSEERRSGKDRRSGKNRRAEVEEV